MPKGEEKGGEKWMTDQPTNTVLLRGLPTSVDEKDVSNPTEMYGGHVLGNMTDFLKIITDCQTVLMLTS